MILLYHKICNIERDWNGLVVKPETFRKQMQYIKNNYVILRGEENWNDFEGNAVVVTFDDGFEDNYTQAFPVLKEFEIPATFFITTGNIGVDKEVWCNELAWIIFEGINTKEKFVTSSTTLQFEYETNSLYQRVELYRILRTLLMKISDKERNCIMEDLRVWGNIRNRPIRVTHKLMSEEQIRDLSKSELVTIGAHTVNHPSLGFLETSEQLNEIFVSKRKLENIIGKKIKLFSYPFGGNRDYSDDTIKILQAVGFDKAMTTFRAIIDQDVMNYKIPRIAVKECDMDFFSKMIESYFNSEKALYSEKRNCIFQYIGRIECDKEIFETDKNIVIWGAGGQGRKILNQLTNWGMKKKIKSFYDSSKSKIGTKIEGIPVNDIAEYSGRGNNIMIIAMLNLENALKQIELYGFRNIHYHI